MNQLQCAIRSRDGDEFTESAEITGEGRSYLACLSDSLSQMQTEVNTVLTQLVEKGKATKISDSSKGSGVTNSGYDGMRVIVHILFHYNYPLSCIYYMQTWKETMLMILKRSQQLKKLKCIDLQHNSL